MPVMLTAQRALVLGDGNGRFLAELLAANRSVAVDAIDISPMMVELARRRVGETDRVRFLVADAGSTVFYASVLRSHRDELLPRLLPDRSA